MQGANVVYGLTQGVYLLLLAPIASFIAVYLLPMGYSNTEIGIILAVGNILALIFQPLISDLADRSRTLSLEDINLIMALMLLLTMLLTYTRPHYGIYLMAVYILMLTVHTVFPPLLNALNFSMERLGFPMNYGICRGIGSITYAAANLLLGVLVTKYGRNVLSAVSIAGGIVLVLVISVLRKICCKKRNSDAPLSGGKSTGICAEREKISGTEEKRAAGLLDFLRGNKVFFALNLSVFFLYIGQQTIEMFMMQIVSPIGGNSRDMGNILSFMSAMEIPMFFFFHNIRKKFSFGAILRFSGIFFFLRMIIIFFAKSPTVVFWSMILQAPSFGLFYPGMVDFINEKMERDEAVKGQAVFTMMITFSTVVCSFSGGLILDGLGVRALILLTLITSAAGNLVLWITLPKMK